jgi:hypothetical protein
MSTTRSTTISDLPTEILSEIDHYLHSTTDRLTCLTVCSRWIPIFKRSLYHWMRIQDTAQFYQLYKSLELNGYLVKTLDLQQLYYHEKKEELDQLATLCPNITSFHADDQEVIEKFLAEKNKKKRKVYSLSTLELPRGNRLLQTLDHLIDLTVSINSLPLELVLIQQLESLAMNIQQGGISRSDLAYVHGNFPNLKSLSIHVGGGITSNDLIGNQKQKELETGFKPCALTIFKFNGITQQNTNSLLLWIHYICQKYPRLKTLELQEEDQASSSSHPENNLFFQQQEEKESAWQKLANHCAQLSQLSLFGYTLDHTFFSTLLSNTNSKLKVLKLSTTTQYANQQASIIPISAILKQYQHSLEELVFWPCHIIRPTLDLIHPNLQLCQNLRKLHISGIYHQEDDDLIEVPIDTLVAYGTHLRHIKLEYITLSYQKSASDKSKSKLQHISLQQVTLSNNVLRYLDKACPHLSHLSLVSCRFLNQTIHIDMPSTRLDFFNLYSPYTLSSYHTPQPHYHIQLNHQKLYYNNQHQIMEHQKQEEEQQELFINKVNDNNNRIIIVIIQCVADQLYLFGNKF